MKDDDKQLRVSQVAAILNCTPRQIYRLIKAQKFNEVFKVGLKKGYRVPLSSVIAFKTRQMEALQKAIEYGEV